MNSGPELVRGIALCSTQLEFGWKVQVTARLVDQNILHNYQTGHKLASLLYMYMLLFSMLKDFLITLGQVLLRYTTELKVSTPHLKQPTSMVLFQFV